MISAAEESTAWPGVSRPTYLGGLGFGFKWNMGWMHDTLDYFQQDPIYRRYHHHELTFSLVYAFTRELHPAALARRGRARQGLAADRRCRATAGRSSPTCARCTPTCGRTPARSCCSWAGEFAQEAEWSHERSLDWHLLEQPEHAGIQSLVRDLNRAYRDEPALWELDFDPTGFWWIEANDADDNVVAFARRSKDAERVLVFVANLSPVPRDGYRLGLPRAGALARGAQHRLDVLRRLATSGNLGGVERRADPAGTASRSRPRSRCRRWRRSGWCRMRTEPRAERALYPWDGRSGPSRATTGRRSSASGRRTRSRSRWWWRGASCRLRTRARRVRVRDRGGPRRRLRLRGRRPQAAGSVHRAGSRAGCADRRACSTPRSLVAAPFETPALDELVIYELHVGTFSREGTFDARDPASRRARRAGRDGDRDDAGGRVPRRARLGLRRRLPVARRSRPTAAREGLARLVDAAHEAGLAVILDVVYNHVGASGVKALEAFGPYFTDEVRDALGPRDQLRRRATATRCASGCSRAPRAGCATSASTACGSTRSTRSSTRAPSTSCEAVARRVHDAEPARARDRRSRDSTTRA